MYFSINHKIIRLHLTFCPKIWAEEAADIVNATKGCESFHGKLNTFFFYSSQLDIFIFLNILLAIQTDTYVIMNSFDKPLRKKVKSSYYFSYSYFIHF